MHKKRVVLSFPPHLIDQAVSYKLIKDYDLMINILRARITPKEQGRLCANGFRDTTRIASGSPEMWRDIALANRENLVRSLDAFMGDLQDFRNALRSRDDAAISRFFGNAKQRRDRWSAAGASPSPE